MRRFFGILTAVTMILATGHLALAQETRVGPSGAPLPRFVSLNTGKAYLRTGPGRQYPIDWVYNRDGLPFEVIDEEGAWRQVRDVDGIKGWVHVSLLSGRRTAMIVGPMARLYADPDARSHLRLTADQGVIGELLACQGDWCQLEIDGTEAWTERARLWGVFKTENFD